MIVGTAGHIDHGKTTLVRALTGVDTDRLPEEKRRGVSIELGYAFLDTSDGRRIGFVDVPGHERLVHTMLAGATGIAHALLLVAADDGVMPQTHEHLAVLSLLGLSSGAVAVTKCDRADAARVASVVEEARALIAPTPLAGSPVLPVSAHTGEGLPTLKQHLFDAAARAAEHPRRLDAFRLAVDRVFVLDGTGTVVTGTVHAGTVRVGDELRLVPGTRSLRVRSVHAQNRAVPEASAGQRCALALAGVEREQVQRGQWLVAPWAALATDRFDARLNLWHGEPRALRSGTPVHVHIGSQSVMGSVAVLEPAVVEPGGSALVQIVLREPAGAWHGDRVVLRDAAASRTLAGGTVLDPLAPVRYRRTPQRLSELQALSQATVGERLAALLAVSPQGLELRRFAAAQGCGVDTSTSGRGEGPLRQHEAQAEHLLHESHAAEAARRVHEALAAYHHKQPDELGPDAARLRRLALPRLPEPLWRALLARGIAQGALRQRGAFVHLPEHGVHLSAVEERLAQKVAQPLLEAGFDGAWVRDLARDAKESEALMRVTLARLSQRGELHQVVKDLYYPPATMARLAALVRDTAAAHGGQVQAADFRDATGLGRKRAIQILEHFDRIGLLRRVGDVHWLRADSQLFAQAPI
ncbi:selenocysteine-specific translation elongation factor [Hydrogenophaga sp. YM1]|uniref:selenocysteine-specific translation elongation factor n=1 Tax=Hydrogenophaga sp. YM1 TaxID=2806262 RepID=UPI001957AF2F|nr:selenocysteine-specific translation elongation factor [Hydrogenophaga sp. YM1]QRR32830.1 selenocysteine-specific translation elongation factor [Hydrogenophaga sp. YM1]